MNEKNIKQIWVIIDSLETVLNSLKWHHDSTQLEFVSEINVLDSTLKNLY